MLTGLRRAVGYVRRCRRWSPGAKTRGSCRGRVSANKTGCSRWGRVSAHETGCSRRRNIPTDMTGSSGRGMIPPDIKRSLRRRGFSTNETRSSCRRGISPNMAGDSRRRTLSGVGRWSCGRVVEGICRRLARSNCHLPRHLGYLPWSSAIFPRLWCLRCRIVRRLGVGLERLAEGLGFLGSALWAWGVAVGQRACSSCCRAEVVWKHLDEVGRKQADCSPVSPQPACPPRAVPCVETFDEVAFDEPEISFGL
jgi:hypothetical protein